MQDVSGGTMFQRSQFPASKRWLAGAGSGIGILLAVCLAACSLGGLPAQKEPRRSKEGMVWVAGGTFWMGSENGQSDEKPVHRVTLDGFWMDRTEVTNEAFAKFVQARGYVTTAERQPDPKDFPDAPRENLIAGSIVFAPPAEEVG